MDTHVHNQPPAGKNVQKVRSLFLSDIHLGSRACRAAELLDFLKGYEASNIFLLGDIVDFWAMSRSLYWPPEHNTVVQKFLKKARHHVHVYLIPGNHDEALRATLAELSPSHACWHRRSHALRHLS